MNEHITEEENYIFMLCITRALTLCILQVISPEGYYSFLCSSPVASLIRKKDAEQILHCFGSGCGFVMAKQETETFWMLLELLQHTKSFKPLLKPFSIKSDIKFVV